MFDWWQNHETLLGWLLFISIASLILSAILVPLVLLRLPADYFSDAREHRPKVTAAHPLVRVLLLMVKNVFAAIFILAGILMLVLPGQGILTIIAGLVLLDFPGKYRAERWLAERGPVRRLINSIRRRAGKEELVIRLSHSDQHSRIGE